MTDEEMKPFIGKAVRVTMADGRIIAGTLHDDDAAGHGHAHYRVVSDPIREGGAPVSETLHGAEQVTNVEDASDDPAAVE